MTDDMHRMCDADIERLGREVAHLKQEVMVLRAVIAELGVDLDRIRKPEPGPDQGA